MSIGDLRHRAGEAVDRAARGEIIMITKAGKPVAELRPLPAPGPSAEDLVASVRQLPPVAPVDLRADVDAVLDVFLAD